MGGDGRGVGPTLVGEVLIAMLIGETRWAGGFVNYSCTS